MDTMGYARYRAYRREVDIMSATSLEIVESDDGERLYFVHGLKGQYRVPLWDYCKARGIEDRKVREIVRLWPYGIYTDLFYSVVVSAKAPPSYRLPRAHRDMTHEQKLSVWRSQRRVRTARHKLARFEIVLAEERTKAAASLAAKQATEARVARAVAAAAPHIKDTLRERVSKVIELNALRAQLGLAPLPGSENYFLEDHHDHGSLPAGDSPKGSPSQARPSGLEARTVQDDG